MAQDITVSTDQPEVEQTPIAKNPAAPAPPPDMPSPRPMPGAAAVMGGAPMVSQPPPFEAKATGMGKVFETLMGYDTQYAIDPETGKEQKTVVQRKPGQFFRSILAGALMGGIAGAGESGFAEGAAKGGAEVRAHGEEQEKTKRETAQQDFARQQQLRAEQREEQRLEIERRREETDSILARATVANMTATQLYNDKMLKNQDRAWAMSQQQMNSDIQQRLLENAAKGIRPLDVPMNGTPGNGEQLMDDYLKHKGQGPYKAAPGSFIQMVPNYDLSGLEYDDNSHSWRDETGKRVDPADRATYTLYEVPVAAVQDQISVPGKTLKDTYGVDVPDLDKNYPVRIIDLLSFSLTKQKEAADGAKEDQAERRLNWQMSYQTLQAKRDALETRRLSIEKDDSILDPARKRALQAPIDREIDTVVDQMEGVMYRMTHDGEEPPQKKETPLPKPSKIGEQMTPDVALLYFEKYGTREAAEQAAKDDGWSVDVEEEEAPKAKSMGAKIKEYATSPERLKEIGLGMINPALPATVKALKKAQEVLGSE